MLRGLLTALLLSFGPTVSNSFARFSYALVLPAMREDLQLSYSQGGWLNTANALGYLAGAILTWTLVRRTGNRLIFSAGMVVTAASLLATGLTTDFAVLTTARLLAGIGGAMVFITGGALAGNIFPGRRSPPRRSCSTSPAPASG
jgi:predicted MFS family arabinose efflux permease